MSRWMGALMIAVVAVLAGASVAGAQYPPSQPPTIVISPDSGPPGYTFTATVTNCVPGQRIVFVFGDQRVEVTCDVVTMQASASFTAPDSLGTYTVTVEFYGDCSSFGTGVSVPQTDVPCFVLTKSVQVVSAGSTTTTTMPGGNIATTGSNGIGSTLQSALILVIAGLGVILVARTRRRLAST